MNCGILDFICCL